MLQQKSFVYSSFCCSLGPLCLCGEEVFSIEQLKDERSRVHYRPGHQLRRSPIRKLATGDLLAASRDGFPGFLVGGAAALGFALVPQLLALGKCEFHFDFAVFEVHADRD